VWTNALGSTKIAGRFLDDAHASVRSEAEDERPTPAASNPTLSAKIKAGLQQARFYFGGAGCAIECLPFGF
jgi:hypothetical protein